MTDEQEKAGWSKPEDASELELAIAALGLNSDARSQRVIVAWTEATTPECHWCEGTGFVIPTGVMCNTCRGTGKVITTEQPEVTIGVPGCVLRWRELIRQHSILQDEVGEDLVASGWNREAALCVEECVLWLATTPARDIARISALFAPTEMVEAVRVFQASHPYPGCMVAVTDDAEKDHVEKGTNVLEAAMMPDLALLPLGPLVLLLRKIKKDRADLFSEQFCDILGYFEALLKDDEWRKVIDG